MLRNSLAALVSLSLGALLAGACDRGTDSDAPEIRAWIDVAPDLPIKSPSPEIGNTTHVFIGFDTVSFHEFDTGWTHFTVSSGFVDLVDPETMPVMLASLSLPAGHYDQIRFHVLRSGLVLGDLYFPLRVGDGESNIYIVTDFCVDESGDIDDLELEWNAENSVHVDEIHGTYWLEPKIAVHSAPVCADDVAAG